MERLISCDTGLVTILPMHLRYVISAVIFPLLLSMQTPARAYDALEACRAQSLLTDDIHNCLDNYLALIDQNLNDLTVYIDRQLRGTERAAFSRAQNSFYSYRRENCLWHLEIGGPRVQAEQVAKNCLSDMSQDRLSELQSLIAGYEAGEVETAFGSADVLSEEITGIDAPEIEEEEAVAAAPEPVPTANTADDEADLGISAFLGDWQVVCTNASVRGCSTDVPLLPSVGDASGGIMRISYRTKNRASVELHFPDEELDAPEKLSWKVDNYSFGSVPGSVISVDDEAAKQIINEVKFVRDELIPLFEGGSNVVITLLDEVGGESGKQFEATLIGFSKARSFANDYIDGVLP